VSPILVFGASGFIGSAILEELTRRNAECAIAAPSGVLRQDDPGLIDDLLRAQQPRAIIQASGLSHHRGRGFHQLYEGNVMPTVRLASALDRIGRRDVPVFVLGSAAELGPTDRPAAETDPCQPHTDYGRSKWFQTLFSLAKNRDGFNFNVLRLFNVVGPGMNPTQVPRCFVDAIVRGDSVLKTGALEYQRDYLTVETAAGAITSLATSGWSGGLAHVCTGRGTTARALIEETLRQTGRTVTIDERRIPAAGDYHSVGVPAVLEAALGRSLPWSTEACIRDLIAHA
jgi:nucleoside-diphosphate-sugar epimerase